jgi:FKBP-type peptidyl-prolyl cis-trans isomerase FkpA
MSTTKTPALILLLAVSSACDRRSTYADLQLETEDDRTLYALGTQMGHSLLGVYPDEHEAEALIQGMLDHLSGTAFPLDYEKYQALGPVFARSRLQAEQTKLESMATRYLLLAQNEPGALKTPGGAIFTTLRPGNESVSTSDVLTMHYIGTLADGVIFDSTYHRGIPAQLDLSRPQLPCWMEGFAYLHVAEKARLVCPPDLAFGAAGLSPNVPPNAVVTYTVEVLPSNGTQFSNE